MKFICFAILYSSIGLFQTLSQQLPDSISADGGHASDCSTNELPIKNKGYFGNNKHLLKVLKKEGFDLPEDYFEQLDAKGLYKGQKLLMKDVKKPFKKRNKKGKNSAAPIEGDMTNHIPRSLAISTISHSKYGCMKTP